MIGQLTADISFDGYQLVRFLGRGGFGEVWLCRAGATGSYHALKFISASDSDLIEKEHHSLALYRSAAAKLQSPHLVPIEHINRHAAGLYYVMPLADGMSAIDPADPAWEPLSLAAVIGARADAPAWFSSKEIIGLIMPLLQALQTLSDASLVHRDVKPENILFFNGSPCLGDISLLGEDAAVITRRGTPGYATPSWYREGLPDMYGAAATLYTLLTGNPPDKMGRAAFLWPHQAESSLPESERAEWKRLHTVIRRATEEKVGERYVNFRAMAAAVGEVPGQSTAVPPLPAARKKGPIAWAAAAGLLVILIGIGAKTLISPTPADSADAPPPVESPGIPAAAPLVGSDTPAVAYEDAQLAYNSLTWIQNDLPRLNLSSEQHNLFQDTLAAIQSHTSGQETFEPELAARKLDLCLDAIPSLREIPNVALARLLLMQAAGDTGAAAKDIGNPVFSSPGTDNLSYRVQLLCRLNAADKAETLIGRVLEDPSLSTRKRYEALVKRAEVRAQQGRHTEAHDDANQALEVTGQDVALKTAVEMKLLRLESDYPGYAAYLKTRPEK